MNDVEVVYRPKTEEEGRRRADRATAIPNGTPFVRLPGNPAPHTVLFVTPNGTKVRAESVEMVFNDALLADAISNWGQDGPLYKDTLADSELMQQVYRYAAKAYEGVEIPEPLRKPEGR